MVYSKRFFTLFELKDMRKRVAHFVIDFADEYDLTGEYAEEIIGKILPKRKKEVESGGIEVKTVKGINRWLERRKK